MLEMEFCYSLCDVASSTTGLHQASDRLSWERRRWSCRIAGSHAYESWNRSPLFLLIAGCSTLSQIDSLTPRSNLRSSLSRTITSSGPKECPASPPQWPQTAEPWAPLELGRRCCPGKSIRCLMKSSGTGRYVAKWVAKIQFPVWDLTSIIFNLLDD